MWSDLNKASVAVMALSASRDPGLLARLREALMPLVEMARWKPRDTPSPRSSSWGASPATPDEAARYLWDRGDREVVIEAAIKGQ